MHASPSQPGDFPPASLLVLYLSRWEVASWRIDESQAARCPSVVVERAPHSSTPLPPKTFFFFLALFTFRAGCAANFPRFPVVEELEGLRHASRLKPLPLKEQKIAAEAEEGWQVLQGCPPRILCAAKTSTEDREDSTCVRFFSLRFDLDLVAIKDGESRPDRH